MTCFVCWFFMRNGGNVKGLTFNTWQFLFTKVVPLFRTFSTLKIKGNMKIKKLLGRGEHNCWGKR